MLDKKNINITVSCVLVHLVAGKAQTITLRAKDTLTAVELNHGENLQFRLRSGRVFHLKLEDTQAAIIEKVKPGGIVYTFSAHLRVDGQPITLRRYVCSQECFYEPYVVNGVRIWLDTVKDVFDLVPIRYPRKGNLQCFPRKSARLALQDMTMRVSPEVTSPWINDGRKRLRVSECYNGDDCYLGPYLGKACHVGLDVNHKRGSILSAPISFDTHAYFNSLKAGDNNNRWRGIRRWPNGEVWALQSHHLIKLLVTQNEPLKRGTPYATTAGVHVGSHEHTHFEFKIGRPLGDGGSHKSPGDPNSIAFPIDFDDQSPERQANPEVLHLDPWIVFWQTFEDANKRKGKIRASMKPAAPGRTGEKLQFSAEGSRGGRGGDRLRYYWTFADGGWDQGIRVTHVFSKAGVYPVTVTIEDGTSRASFTQHISVSGKEIRKPALALSCEDELSFRQRPVWVADTYAEPPRWVPHTLLFEARKSRPKPRVKVVRLTNIGRGTLPPAAPVRIRYLKGQSWLDVASKGLNNNQSLKVKVDAAGLSPGAYNAIVSVNCRAALNSPQAFRVELRVKKSPPHSDVTIDNGDTGFYATPYFWVGHRFCRCPVDRRGHNGFYLTNGGRASKGEFVRFTPDLQAGWYTISFPEETPFQPGAEFNLRVRHRKGERVLRVRPPASRAIGTFFFDQGTDGFVEIRAENSKGQVIADALRFRRES